MIELTCPTVKNQGNPKFYKTSLSGIPRNSAEFNTNSNGSSEVRSKKFQRNKNFRIDLIPWTPQSQYVDLWECRPCPCQYEQSAGWCWWGSASGNIPPADRINKKTISKSKV